MTQVVDEGTGFLAGTSHHHTSLTGNLGLKPAEPASEVLSALSLGGMTWLCLSPTPVGDLRAERTSNTHDTLSKHLQCSGDTAVTQTAQGCLHVAHSLAEQMALSPHRDGRQRAEPGETEAPEPTWGQRGWLLCGGVCLCPSQSTEHGGSGCERVARKPCRTNVTVGFWEWSCVLLG